MIDMRERAIRAVGAEGLERLEKAGLKVEMRKTKPDGLARIHRYDRSQKPVIASVFVVDEGRRFPVASIEPEGYEIIYAAKDSWVFTDWIGINGCKDLR